MNNSPYTLRNGSGCSTQFYRDLTELADLTYSHVMAALSAEIDAFARHRSAQGEERTREEYMIELLTLAMVWREYLGGSQRSLSLVVSIQKKLYALRCLNSRMKRFVDPVRALLSGLFIYPVSRVDPKDDSLSLKNLERLVEWLHAAGEFTDEVKRFRHWLRFFAAAGDDRFQWYMKEAMRQLELFAHNAESSLGRYTAGVEPFRRELMHKERWREDGLFRNKTPLEYHINMLASEIINRGFSGNYRRTSRRVVLLPACMCEKDDHHCKRVVHGADISCTSCSSTCSVGKIQRICIERGHSLNIVPHSSSFTKWLKRWENSTECGLVAVACPLNIVVGGYQMRELNIPSQCVLLDYCGCAKHWGPESVPTAVNVDRLLTFLYDDLN